MKRPALDCASATRPVTAAPTYLVAAVTGRYRTVVDMTLESAVFYHARTAFPVALRAGTGRGGVGRCRGRAAPGGCWHRAARGPGCLFVSLGRLGSADRHARQ